MGGGKFMPSNSGEGILLFITSADNDKLKIFCDWKERVVEKCIVWVILCLFFFKCWSIIYLHQPVLAHVKLKLNHYYYFYIGQVCFAGVIREYLWCLDLRPRSIYSYMVYQRIYWPRANHN